METRNPAEPEPSRDEVEVQLERITGSADFDTTARTREFLRFIVGQVLEGNPGEISQYAIGTRVFGRREDFNPSDDPIVRIQAGRLRRSLEHYYLTSGSGDPVRISVPKGTYVPDFHRRQSDRPADAGGTPAKAFEEACKEAVTWPAVLVTPFQNLTGDPQRDYLGQGLATELSIELDCYQIVRVFMQPAGADGTPAGEAGTAIRFRIEGSIETRAESLCILIRLLDTASGVQIWGRKFRCELDDPELSSFLEEVAMSVAAALADERGIIMRHLFRERPSVPPTRPDSHDAILRFYHFNASPSSGSFSEVLAGLRKAVEANPDRGLLWSLLARMSAVNYSLEIIPEATPIDEAYAFARKGVNLEPDNQRTHGVLAFVHLLRDELEAGRREAEAALNLNPNSFVFIDALGYLLALLGDWDRGLALTEKAIRLNPFHQPSIHFVHWLNHLRLEHYGKAYQQAMAVGDHGGFWAPLVRAAALGHLGRLDEARRETARILEIKPEFPDRWHWLITRYVKFDELVELIVAGLNNAGLELRDP